jgi:alpha-beta hydrolase superfamily lysophospholipase
MKGEDLVMEREDHAFESGGERCAAWLYPAQGEAPFPAIVMAHGLSGTRRDCLGPFAERFAAAGVAALVFDHRGFGDSGGEPDLFTPAASSRTGGRRSPSPAPCPA